MLGSAIDTEVVERSSRASGDHATRCGNTTESSTGFKTVTSIALSMKCGVFEGDALGTHPAASMSNYRRELVARKHSGDGLNRMSGVVRG